VAELRKVVIAGGGVGGCAVALALRRAGIAVEIHEKYGDFQGRPRASRSGRTRLSASSSSGSSTSGCST
jgi:2-polyprenyl-6-methoxyphenol hydroxylase-like FAD-dependent oxidoreductase